MSFNKLSTLTSGVLAVAKDIKKCKQERLDINIVKAEPNKEDKILVVDIDCNKVTDYDQIIKSIKKNGFGVVISDKFTPIYTVKAVNEGIVNIEISTLFLKRIVDESKHSDLKLFVDFIGQELMIVNTGEKEYFKLSEYCLENYDCAFNDVDNLYSVWENMDKSTIKEELYDYAIV